MNKTEYMYIIQIEGCKSFKVGRTDRGLKRLKEYGKHTLYLIQAVSNCRDAETELLQILRQKFKSGYEENHSTESFYGEYVNILHTFLDVTLKYTPSDNNNDEEDPICQTYKDEIEDPSHEYLYEYHINTRYMKDGTLPKTLDVNINLSNMSYADVRNVCKEYFPDMGISLTMKKIDLEKTIMDCNKFIMEYKGINKQRDKIPDVTVGNVDILNLKRLCKNDRISLRRTLKLKKNISLEMHYKEMLNYHHELEIIVNDVKKYPKENIISVLSMFVPCDMKMRKDELVKLAQDVVKTKN